MSPPPAGAAASVPATRRSLRRRWLWVAVVVALVACLFAASWLTARARSDDAALQQDGVGTQATVLDVVSRHVGRSAAVDGSLHLGYEAAGQRREASVYVGTTVGDYRAGQSVAIVYDATDPGRVQLVGRPPPAQGVPLLLLLALGVMSGALALVGVQRAWWVRRLLRGSAWQVVGCAVLQVPYRAPLRRGSRTLLRLAPPTGPVLVEPVGLNRADVTFEPESWVVGLGGERLVLAPVGGRHLLAVRRRRGTG